MKITTVFTLLILINYSVFSQNNAFGKISLEELSEECHPKDSLASATYLFKECKTSFVFNIQTLKFELYINVHERIKIYTPEGIQYATHRINYSTPKGDILDERVIDIKGYRYNLEEGNVVRNKFKSQNISKSKTNNYYADKTLIFQDIKPGDIIEYKYTIISPNCSIRDLDFQTQIPIKELSYKTETPEFFNYKKINIGPYTVKPVIDSLRMSISSVDKFRTWGNAKTTRYTEGKLYYTSKIETFSKQNIPAFSDQIPFVDNPNNYKSGLKYELISTHFPSSPVQNLQKTWGTVCKSIYESDEFGKELKISNYYKNDLKKIIKDKSTLTEKTSAILNFVKKQITWNDSKSVFTNKGVKKAYKMGTGNSAEINLILVSMLRKAGLTAYPVVISTRDHGIPVFPTIDGFNYVIAAVENESNTYDLLDATEYYSSVNTLPLRALNWEGRIITNKGESAPIIITPNTIAESTKNIHISIEKNLAISGTYQRKLTGLAALSYRSTNNKKTNDEHILDLENKLPIEIINIREVNKEDPSKPYSQVFQFASSETIFEKNDTLYIEPLLYHTLKENVFRDNQREIPINYGSPWKKNTNITIQIPTGYKIESIPNNFGVGLPDELGIFSFRIEENNNQIVISSIESINIASIPSNYYLDLKGYYDDIIEHQRKKIILTKIE